MSPMATFSLGDYLVLVGMLTISSGIGIYYAWKGRQTNSNKEFLLGGGHLSIFPVSMSLLASFQSSVTVLGYPAEMYTRGTQFWVMLISACVAVLVPAHFFLPLLHPLKLTSVNKYLQLRFNSNAIRLLASFSFLISQLLYMGVVLYGPSLALGSVTNIPVWLSIFLIGLCCTFYTAIGGMKAVVWTDVIQVVVMYAGLLIVLVKGTIDLGGLKRIWEIAEEGGRIQFLNIQPDLYSTTTLWNVVFGMGFVWTSAYSITQTQVQRYSSISSYQRARIALYINLPGLLVILSLACLCGLVLYATYHDCDPLKLGLISQPDQLMPFYVMDKLSFVSGLAGLFVSSVFSGSLSTLSSGFNSLAAVTWDDFLKPCWKAEGKKEVVVTKVIAAIFGVITIGVAFLAGRIGSILRGAIGLSGAIYGPLLAVFLLGAAFPACNAKGAISGLAIGEILSMWVVIGSIIYPRPHFDLLPTSTVCAAGNDSFSIVNVFNSSMVTTTTAQSQLASYSPSGIFALYHISPLLNPVFGFLVALFIGLLVSFLTGCNKGKTVDPSLLLPCVRSLQQCCCTVKHSHDFDQKEHIQLVPSCANTEMNAGDDTELVYRDGSGYGFKSDVSSMQS